MEPLPALDVLNGMKDGDAIASIRVLFEPAPVLERYVLSIRPWSSYEDLIDKSARFVEQLLKDDRREDVLSVLNAHPKIGANPATLSADSRIEQGAAGDPEVLRQLDELNHAYEKRHGFRFVVFVNGRPKDVILGVLKERINNDTKQEMATAGAAMMDIARDRLRKRKQKL